MIQIPDLNKLKEGQLELAKKIKINNQLSKISTIAGCEVIGQGLDQLICCIIVFEFPSLKFIEKKIKHAKVAFPYYSTFQAFREGPIIVNTFAELDTKPDVLIVKGHGISHPRRIGIASQMGLQLGIPTIGVAQKIIAGKIKEDKVFLKQEVVSKILKTKEFANPIFVSPGHMISLAKAVEIVKKVIVSPHKLPEPLFLAHKCASRKKKEIKILTTAN